MSDRAEADAKRLAEEAERAAERKPEDDHNRRSRRFSAAKIWLKLQRKIAARRHALAEQPAPDAEMARERKPEGGE